MPAIALHTVLTAGREGDYAAVHRSIPDAVATALRSCGIRDWRIWLDGRHVFHLVDVEDEADYRRMRETLRDDPDNQAWQATVGPMFDRADDYAGADPVVPRLWSLADQLHGRP